MNELKININLDNDAFYPQPRENKVGQVTYFYEVKGA